ncbi:GrpE, mitochondrial [Coemansia asiatica]|uniref:GrpE protein homolog, mitochondrial n=1 Tax=Coemansia asiatica TaxID=1052880 RepID=A0A9W8CIL8_9FUNG|nr:GrpE, mitochondrial [Coemansia asiatica]
MLRSVFASVYRNPFIASTAHISGSRSATCAFARRLYSDKPKQSNKEEEPANKEEAAKKEETAQETASISSEQFEKLKKSVTEKDAKIKELKDSYLRSLADAENIRTRSKTEVDNTKLFAIQKFAKDLLDTVDILELALRHVPKEHLVDKVTNKSLVDLHEGVEMTRSNLLKTLERHGVESFDPIDKPYDPNTSHALYQAPVPGKTPGSVFAVEKRGYIIKGRVLRPAQVGVVVDPSGN